MKTFKDSTGRPWLPALNLASLRRVKTACGVDLMQPHDGTPPLVARLFEDPTLLCDVTFAIVQPEAEKLSVSADDFAASLDGTAMAAARDALMTNLVEFYADLARADLADLTRTFLQAAERNIQSNTALVERSAAALERQLTLRTQEALEKLDAALAANESSAAPTP